MDGVVYLDHLVDARREEGALGREAQVCDGLTVAVHRPEARPVLPVPYLDDVIDRARVEDVRLRHVDGVITTTTTTTAASGAEDARLHGERADALVVLVQLAKQLAARRLP